jgi:hypothetical protein
MLRIVLGTTGFNSRVELDGVDISKFIRAVMVSADATAGAPKVMLEYLGAAVVEMADGAVELHKADLLVTCGECRKVLKGQPADVTVVETSGYAQSSKTYEPVPEGA